MIYYASNWIHNGAFVHAHTTFSAAGWFILGMSFNFGRQYDILWSERKANNLYKWSSRVVGGCCLHYFLMSLESLSVGDKDNKNKTAASVVPSEDTHRMLKHSANNCIQHKNPQNLNWKTNDNKVNSICEYYPPPHHEIAIFMQDYHTSIATCST